MLGEAWKFEKLRKLYKCHVTIGNLRSVTFFRALKIIWQNVKLLQLPDWIHGQSPLPLGGLWLEKTRFFFTAVFHLKKQKGILQGLLLHTQQKDAIKSQLCKMLLFLTDR